MWRERARKIVLIVVGLLFTAGIYPIADSLRHADQKMYSDDMMLSLYVALGIFLLLAVRDPAANRSLIAFAAWSSFAHAAVMSIMAFQKPNDHELRYAVALFAVIGIVLIAVAPARKSDARPLAATA
jgi:peptidoglycan/LPS O-acetylase OafA/YrhL